MFQLYITIGYFIPAIYIFFRIKSQFINKGYRLLYTIVFLIMASISPLARYSRGEMTPFKEMLNLVSGYLVPFFLYLFLSLLLYDIFLLVNLGVKAVPREKRRTFRYKLYTLSAIVVTSVLVVVGGAINLNTIQVSEYTIEVPRKQTPLNSLRIAFVADFHIDRHTKLKYVEQYVRKVKALKPDILLYGGDIVEGRWDKNVSAEIINALKSIKPKYGAYGILGNHEFYGSDDPGRLYPMINVVSLRDEVVKAGNDFYVAGRLDDMVEERLNVDEVLGKRNYNLPLLLLDHRPTQLQEASRTQTNVQFSGHTHNGQMFPLNYILKSMYELSWGYKKIKDTHFFVTSGLRLWGPPVKTAGKSEIMVVDVNFR